MLTGWAIVDLSTGIPGAYCTKLLADGGADVVKVGPPADGAPLFQFLDASKRTASVGDLDDLLTGADAVVWSPGSIMADPSTILGDHPHLTVTSITHFGLTGPWAGRPATEFTLQAWSGGVIGLGRGDPARAPVHVGGRVGEWLTGAYAAVGTMVSRMRGRGGELVDVSMLETLAACLTYYPVTYFDVTQRPFRPKRSVMTPGVGIAKDGMIAVGVGTGQQWLDFCHLVGHPEWTEDKSLFRERSHLAPEIDKWFSEHTVAEIRDLATAFRLPNAPIANGENLPTMDHFEARGSFVKNVEGGFIQPGPPYRIQAASSEPAANPESLSLRGLRVLDMTAFWAGPVCTHPLAMLGAEVIHLESIRRLDGTRMLGAAMTEEQWWERSPIFSGINTNKKSVTIDFGSERGMEVLKRLIATTDVIVENYTPRVFDQAGLTFEALQAIKNDIVVVRMPGFGLDGPWRDQAAFAYTIEDASGMTWMTGYPDDKPLEPYCVGDPTAGIHALAALLLALEQRRRTGEGVFVEAAMIDAAINVTAEQVIEYSTNGTLLERAGNHGPDSLLQDLFRTADPDERGGNDSWVAIAVETDEQRQALIELVEGDLAEWCAQRGGDEIVDLLWPAGIPVAKVMQPHRQGDVPQLQARGFFETVEHPVLGAARHATLPMTFSNGPDRRHTRHAPLLGEHNTDLLTELGYTDDEIAALEAEGVIGKAPAL